MQYRFKLGVLAWGIAAALAFPAGAAASSASGMLTLPDLLAQEDLGGFSGRRCKSLSRAVSVAVVHEPDVLLCARPTSNARHGVRPSCA